VSYVSYLVEHRIHTNESEDDLSITYYNWDDLKTAIQKIPQRKRRLFENLAYVLFGIAGSDLVGAIALLVTTGLPGVALTILALVFLGAIIFGVGSLYIDNTEQKISNVSIDEVLRKMEGLEGQHYKAKDDHPSTRSGS
jgi:hypothetical protein